LLHPSVPSQLRKPGADDSAPDRYSADRDDPFPMGEQERRRQQQEGGPVKPSAA
jgi:hypothetical protein